MPWPLSLQKQKEQNLLSRNSTSQDARAKSSKSRQAEEKMFFFPEVPTESPFKCYVVVGHSGIRNLDILA